MKKFFYVFLTTIMCALLFVGCADTSPNNTDFNSNENNIASNENLVVGLFLEYAQYDYEGNYRFRKYDNLNNVSFSYCFT